MNIVGCSSIFLLESLIRKFSRNWGWASSSALWDSKGENIGDSLVCSAETKVKSEDKDFIEGGFQSNVF